MYLHRYSCCLILLLLTMYGCSSTTEFSAKTRLFLTCMEKAWDYENKCMCEVYPKGYRKEDYCDAWTFLRMKGYLVPLDIPGRD